MTRANIIAPIGPSRPTVARAFHLLTKILCHAGDRYSCSSHQVSSLNRLNLPAIGGAQKRAAGPANPNRFQTVDAR